MASDRYTFTNVRVRHETKLAYLCEIGGIDFWIPKSQILGSHPALGVSFVTTTFWWAEKVGANEAFERSEAERQTRTKAKPLELPAASRIYRRLAAKYHPDRNSDAEEFMTDLNELWQAVREDTKKQR
jgi:DnaJ domain